MKFEDYYKEFCEVLGHPLWMIPTFMIGFFFMVEVMHTRYHALGVYGELSGITDEDTAGDDIVNWGAKLGAKFSF